MSEHEPPAEINPNGMPPTFLSGAPTEQFVAQSLSGHQRPAGEQSEAWATSEDARNIHQRIAVKTHDWLTLANVATVAGGVLSAYGLREYTRGNRAKALAFVGVGRLFDLADGAIATRCGTRSAKGALLDAGTDKLLTVAAGVVLTRQGTIGPAYAAATAIDQGRIAYHNTQIKKAGGEPNPSLAGKRAMAVLWTGLGLRAAEQITKRKHTFASRLFGIAAVAAESTTLGLTEVAIQGYKQQRKELTA